MRVLWLLLAASAHAFLALARRRTCVRQRSIEEDLTAELDAVAEGAEAATEEAARTCEAAKRGMGFTLPGDLPKGL